jgi:PAS domain S-box-containing protein
LPSIAAAADWLSIWERATTDYCISLLSPAGVIKSWNAGGEHIHRYPPEEIIGRHFSVFYTEGDRAARIPEAALAAARDDGRQELEGWRLRKDGSAFWANVVLTRLDGPAGKMVGFAKRARNP